MLSLLIKVRLQSARNALSEAWQRRPLLTIALTLLGTGLFALVTAGFFLFWTFAARLHVLPEAVTQIFYFLFLFLLAGSVPFVASTLLQSNDYPLLFAAPIPPRAIVAAKLLDATVTNSLQFTILGIPALVACAFILPLPLWGWLLLPLLVALFVLLPALLTSLGLLLLLRVLGLRRMRNAVAVLNAVMAVVVCFTIVLEAGHLPLNTTANHLSAGLSEGTLSAPVAAHSPAAHAAPSAPFADVLLAMAASSPGHIGRALGATGLIIVFVGGLFWGCVALGSRLLSAASVADEDGPIQPGSRLGNAADARLPFWQKRLSPVVSAVIVKDWRYLRRDTVLLSQLTMPLLLFCVPFLLLLQGSDNTLGTEGAYAFSTIMIGIIVFMQTSIFALSSIGLEGRAFWMLRVAPHPASIVLRAKFLLSAGFTSACATVLTLFAGVVFRAPPLSVIIQEGFVLGCCIGLCGLNVGLSAIFPRFIYENPAHRVSVWALVLGFFVSTGYLLGTGVLFGLAWFVATRFPGHVSGELLYGLSALLYIVATLYGVVLLLTLGARRLEGYAWEH